MMFLGQVLQVLMSSVCLRPGVRRFDVLVQCGPLHWDSLISFWMRAVLVVMMRVNGVKSAVHDEMNEM